MLKVSLMNIAVDDFSGSFSGGYEYYCLRGCDVM